MTSKPPSKTDRKAPKSKTARTSIVLQMPAKQHFYVVHEHDYQILLEDARTLQGPPDSTPASSFGYALAGVAVSGILTLVQEYWGAMPWLAGMAVTGLTLGSAGYSLLAFWSDRARRKASRRSAGDLTRRLERIAKAANRRALL